MPAKKRTASPAQLRALARGRAKLKLARKRGTVTRKKAAAPKRRVRRANPDRALMRTRTLSSGLKAGKKRLSNPSMYVVYDGKRYFDGAGWTVAKKHAAHYTMERLAKLIGQKIADVTNKSVYVVSA